MSKKKLATAAIVAATGAIALSSTPVSAFKFEDFPTYDSRDNSAERIFGIRFVSQSNLPEHIGDRILAQDITGRTPNQFYLSDKYLPYNPSIEYQEFPISEAIADSYTNQLKEIDSDFDLCTKANPANTQECQNTKLASLNDFYEHTYINYDVNATWKQASQLGGAIYGEDYGFSPATTGYEVVWIKVKNSAGAYVYDTVLVYSKPVNPPAESTKQTTNPAQLPKTGQFERNLTLVLAAVAMVSVGAYLASVAKRLN